MDSNICQRLFRFILGRLRLPSALPAPSSPIPVEEGSPRNGKTPPNPDITVEFRHISAKAPHQDRPTSSEDDQATPQRSKGKGVKNGVSMMESGRRRENDPDLVAVMDDWIDDDTKPRRHWPLLSVASNINEKSEEYIERKKKAMIRNYSLDQDQNQKK